MKDGSGTLTEYTRWAVFLLAFFGFGVKAGLIPVNFFGSRRLMPLRRTPSFRCWLERP